jgi:hypothetical protein
MFRDEAELQAHTETFMSRLGVPHEPHPVLKNGSCPDIGIRAADGNPCAIIEIKNGISLEASKVSDLSGYFEQCAKYHLATGLPVFLGPWFSYAGGISHMVQGGETASATAAFSAMAGRINVGLFIIHTMVPKDPARWDGLTLMLRGSRVARHDINNNWGSIWPSTAQDIKLVDLYRTAASKKQRAVR